MIFTSTEFNWQRSSLKPTHKRQVVGAASAKSHFNASSVQESHAPLVTMEPNGPRQLQVGPTLKSLPTSSKVRKIRDIESAVLRDVST